MLDLDACLWLPEMFELAGAPREPGDGPAEVLTTAGERVRLIPSALEATTTTTTIIIIIIIIVTIIIISSSSSSSS